MCDRMGLSALILYCTCGFPRPSPSLQGKGCRLLAGAAAVPTVGGDRRPQPRRRRHPTTTPAPPTRIAPVVREDNMRSQPLTNERRSVHAPISGASPQPSVIIIMGAGVSSRRGRAPCGAPPSLAPAPRVRAHPSCPSCRRDTATQSTQRHAALPVLRGRSSLPPSAHRIRRGSPRPERSRICLDNG